MPTLLEPFEAAPLAFEPTPAERAAASHERRLILAQLVNGAQTLGSVLEQALAYEDARGRSQVFAEALWAEVAEHPAVPEGSAALSTLLDQNLRGLDFEARLQHSLGAFSTEALTLLLEALNTEIAAAPLPAECALGRLHHQSEPFEAVPGLVLVTTPEAFAQPHLAGTVFLAWSRLPGGLMAFESLERARVYAEDELGLLLAYTTEWRAAGAGAFKAALLDQVNASLAIPAGAANAEQRLDELLPDITLPAHWPRDLALLELLTHEAGSLLQAHYQPWLEALASDQRERLIDLLAQHCDAQEAERSHTQQQLATRLAFIQAAVTQQLQQSFEVARPGRVILDLPARLEDRLLPSGSEFPSYDLVPSAEREQWPLAQLLLHNIDDDLAGRLAHLRVSVEGTDPSTAELLAGGISRQWVIDTANTLDLASAYEQYLWAHYQASADPADSRQALLRRPYETALALLAEIAQQQGVFSAEDGQTFSTAIHAHNAEMWGAISLKPVAFTLFDEDHETAGAQVEGAMLISDAGRGRTLLYLPASPAAQLTAHDGEAEALAWLADQCLAEPMRRYLAERALAGDPAWLEARLDQALIAGFRGLFETRATWPPERSMAQQLLNEHTGRLIRQHRATSRSNGDLYAQSIELSRARVVDGIRFALGMMPGFGTVIDIAEGLFSLYKAVRHFEHSEAPEGLVELQMTLVIALGAVIDFLPAGAAGSPAGARAMARARQAQTLPQLNQQRVASQVRRGDTAFAGYALEHTLEGGTVHSSGHFDGVIELDGAYYIQRKSQAYAVQWDDTAHTWRLAPQGTKTYRQPIARGSDGQWESHGFLHGHLLLGGGLGGGNALQGMANVAHGRLPLWLRRYLPQRLLAQLETRQQHLERELTEYTQLRATSNDWVRRAQVAPENAVLHQQTLAALDQEIRANQALELTLGDLTPRQLRQMFNSPRHSLEQLRAYDSSSQWNRMQLIENRRRHLVESVQGINGEVMVQRQQLLQLSQQLSDALAAQRPADELLQLQAQIEAAIAELVRTHQSKRPLYVQLLVEEDLLSDALEALRKVPERLPITTVDGYLRTSSGAARDQWAKVKVILERIQERLGVRTREVAQVLKTYTLLNLVLVNEGTPAWARVREHYLRAVEHVDRATDLYVDLPKTRLGRRERAFIEQQLNDDLDAFSGKLKALARLHPALIDTRVYDRLLEQLANMRARPARASQAPARTGGQHPLRPFQDADGNWMLGQRQADGSMRVERLERPEETWIAQDNGQRFSRQGAPAPAQPNPASADAGAVRREAAQALEHAQGAQGRAQALQRASTTTGADLEDQLALEATPLETYARQLGALGTPEDLELAAQLRAQAEHLRSHGHSLRLAHSLDPAAPTAGRLAWLLEHNQATLRRTQPRRHLSGADGGDYLEEFEVSTLEGQPLWYAHFHLKGEHTPLADFSKAHLKTAEQRHLGLNWQRQQGENAPAILRADLGPAFVYRYLARFQAA
ncbi:dermonecrotic toxin domain-containing protein [Pseudomonas sp. NPDC007930]|uniref:dermonecrotic toxin domain-containing protein n=1 Tax=Pseudomonas sp. NPDC007930 TaxID=3364417 RepID=UPI0036E2B62A